MRRGNPGNHGPFYSFLIRGSGLSGGRSGLRAPSGENPVLRKKELVGVDGEISAPRRRQGNPAGPHAKAFHFQKAAYLRLGGCRLWCRMLESAGRTI